MNADATLLAPIFSLPARRPLARDTQASRLSRQAEQQGCLLERGTRQSDRGWTLDNRRGVASDCDTLAEVADLLRNDTDFRGGAR